MRGLEVFLLIFLLALALFSFEALVGLRSYTTGRWNAISGVNLGVALEFTLGAIILSVLPFVLAVLLGMVPHIWGVGSFVLAVFLLLQIARIYVKMNTLQARWPLVMATLLVLSGIVLSIEVINSFWWGSLAWYAYGLLWIMAVAAIQLIAFALYDVERSDAFHPGLSPAPPQPVDHQPRLRGLMPERMRRERRAAHPDRAPDDHANIYRDPVAFARRERYAHRYPLSGADTRPRRTNANPAVRPNPNRRSR